jgi:hypothetical protein
MRRGAAITHEADHRQSGPGRALATLGAAVVLAAALGATFIAFLLWRLNCDELPREQCTTQLLAHVQLAVAIAGLIPAVDLVLKAAAGRGRPAALALGWTAAVYAAWVAIVTSL